MAEEKNFGLSIENARIIFRNFSGKESQFNRAGDRNFCVIIEPDDAERLRKDGWNVKTLRARDEDEDVTYYIPVKVAFNQYPPNVWLVSDHPRNVIIHKMKTSKVKLDEDTIGELDYLSIDHCDISIRPYHWEINGKSGIKAYLKTLYVVAEKDEFAYKYEDTAIEDEDIPF